MRSAFVFVLRILTCVLWCFGFSCVGALDYVLGLVVCFGGFGC